MQNNETFSPSALLYRGSGSLGDDGGEQLGWNFPADYMDYIHPHWRQFRAPQSYQHFLLGMIYAVITVVGLFGNLLVLWAFATVKSLRTPSNLFVANLAVLDTVMMVKLPIFVLNSVVEGQFFGKIGCDLGALLGAIAGMGAAVTNAVIAYDRYRTIAFPLDGRLGMKQAVFLVVGIWIYAMPFSLLPLTQVWSRYVPEGYLTVCSIDYMKEGKSTQLFVMCIFAWAYVIPLSLIAMFYSRILTQVRSHEKMLQEQAKRMNVKSLSQGQDKEQSVEIRIAKVAIGIVILFICAWTPHAMVAMMGCFSDRAFLTPTLSMFPAIAAKAVACVDPWVYAINHPRFRAEIQKKIPWLCIFGKESDSSDTSSCGTEKSNIKEESA